MRKKIFISGTGFVFFLICVLFSCNSKKKSLQELEKKANLTVESFQKELLETLQTSIKEKGIAGAIEKCNVSSPLIEEKFSKLEGAEIKRVSLKNRNPAHSPKNWETEVLSKWEEKIAKKEPIGVFAEETETEFRILKPITIASPTCLKCHGANEIEKNVAEKIQSLYPNDKATGYKMGDLRGGFSIIWKK